MARPLKTISIRLPEERHRQLQVLAEYRGMPPAVMIRSLVYQELDQAAANMVGMQAIMQEMASLGDAGGPSLNAPWQLEDPDSRSR